MATKHTAICQKAWVRLTPIPVNEMATKPMMMINRGPNRSARIEIGTCPKPYEMLKEITRGRKATIDDFYEFVKKLDISKEVKNKLLFVTPENYTGLAAKIVEKFDPKIN